MVSIRQGTSPELVGADE
jgi:proteasomal ATPase-associated factor 1